MNCPTHKKEFRDGKFGQFCATKLEDGGWCKEKPPKDDGYVGEKEHQVAQTSNEFAESLGIKKEVDWEAKDRQSMSQTSLKSASEIVAALIAIGDPKSIEDAEKMVKKTANFFYKELKGMKEQE